jgi:predicted transcriptional regulator
MDTLSPKSITKRREALGLTRSDLAGAAKVAESTLWRIETEDKGGTIATWRALLSALDAVERERAA